MLCSAIMHLTDELLRNLHVHLSVAAGISEIEEGVGAGGAGGRWHGCIRAAVQEDRCPL